MKMKVRKILSHSLLSYLNKMSAFIQVLSFLFSFIFGGILCFIGFIVRKKVNKRHIIFNVLYNVIFVSLFSLIYMYGLYKINNGILHEYFIFVLLLGYYFIRVKICKYR